VRSWNFQPTPSPKMVPFSRDVVAALAAVDRQAVGLSLATQDITGDVQNRRYTKKMHVPDLLVKEVVEGACVIIISQRSRPL